MAGRSRGPNHSSVAEALALTKQARQARAAEPVEEIEEEAEEQGPTASEMADFRAWQAEKDRRAAQDSIGVQGINFEPSKTDGLLAFGIVGEMPAQPGGTKGAYLNSNTKVIMDGQIYTLLVSLFPYKGQGTVAKLKGQGDVVGEHKSR